MKSVIDASIKKGQTWVSNTSSLTIEIISKRTDNGHWNTKKLNGSKKSHSIHESTLLKFYKLKD